MRKLITLFCLFCCILASNAEDIKRPDSYNYTRGVEAMHQGNYPEALEYLNKELENDPQNGYAVVYIAAVYNNIKDYGKALTAVDKAVNLIPKKDKVFRSNALNLRAQIYYNLEKKDEALKAYTQAIKEVPNDPDNYRERAQLYYELGEYELADNDYRQLIQLNQGDSVGYLGLGRNADAQGKYDQAIEHYDYAIKLAPDNASGYSFRAESLIKQGKYSEAATDVVTALGIENDSKAFVLMQDLAKAELTTIATKLQAQASKEPLNMSWPYYLGIVHEHTGNYSKALGYYKDALKLDNSPIIEKRISSCYGELGNYPQSLNYINMSIQSGSTDAESFVLRARANEALGNAKEAIADWSCYIATYPEYFLGYYNRGFAKEYSGDIEGAIEDYTASIKLDPRPTFVYVNRGNLYNMIGETQLARKDFEEALARDSLQEDGTTIYALFHLGKVQEAKDLIQKLLAAEGEDAVNCYQAACLYSLAGDTDTSLEYLRKSFEKGNRNLHFFKRDRNLNNLRETPGYKQLMDEFEQKLQQEISSAETAPAVAGGVE